MTIVFLILTGFLIGLAYACAVAKSNQHRRVCGLMMSGLSVVSVFVFFYMQNISGGADYGRGMDQILFPLCGYALVFLIGIAVFAKNRQAKV